LENIFKPRESDSRGLINNLQKVKEMMTRYDMKVFLKATKYLKYVLAFFLIIFIVYAVFMQDEGFGAAVEAESDLSITTSPSSSFINAPNMTPGQQVTAPLTVKNEGTLDFSYDIDAVMENGSDMYFNALDLVIKDSTQNILYNGKLKDLNNLVLGVLGAGGTDVFDFIVGFPGECGNEYQGLSTGVTFVLDAVEHPPYIEGGGVVWDPPLEKPDVHVRKGVIMPMRVHLIKNGTFETVKRGIDLIITGVNNEDQPVKYTFSVTDGTLEWEEHGLHKPHYQLMFDAEKYPVKLDTYYTATVKYGDQILEPQTKFISGH